MTATLTERYVAAAVKGLPRAAEDDVRAELTVSIADAVEARVEQGEDPGDAERAVLTELGDPAVLAAGYADRPLQLIGPRHYLTWLRLLKLLLAIVPACAVGGVALGQSLAGEPVGTIVGQSVVVGLTVVVHLCFWVTLVFAVIDRSGADTATPWDVDQLPEPQPTGTGRADLVVSLVFLGLAAGAILWDRLVGFVRPDGAGLPILDPGLWPWAITALLVLMGLEAVLAVVVFVRGRWTAGLATANAALAVAVGGGAVTLLARGQLVNPAFLDEVLVGNGVDQDALRVLGVLLGFSVAGIAAWDAIDGWLKARRDARRPDGARAGGTRVP